VSALDSFFTAPAAPQSRLTLSNAPEGRDAQALGDLAAQGAAATLLHVCRDDGRLARLKADLAFFHPGLTVLTFPAWDCLPYDRVSPNPEIMSRRIDTLPPPWLPSRRTLCLGRVGA
jgi:transcription-repair coupling factor (superfamily II helicase)